MAGSSVVRRWFVAGLLAVCSAVAQSSVDANLGSLAEIERIKGIGTSLAANILDARAKGTFKDWGDLIRRVKGIGANKAARLSAEGLTVNGAPFNTQSAPPPAAQAPEAPPGK